MQEAGHDFHLVIKMLTVLERHLCTISLQSFILLLKLWVCKFISTTVLHLKFKHLTRASTYPFNLFFQPEVKGFKSYILRLRTHNSAPIWENDVTKLTGESANKLIKVMVRENGEVFDRQQTDNNFTKVRCKISLNLYTAQQKEWEHWAVSSPAIRVIPKRCFQQTKPLLHVLNAVSRNLLVNARKDFMQQPSLPLKQRTH